MIIVPCSMKTLAGVGMRYYNDLITRAASVTLKEQRRSVLVARQTPLSDTYIQSMLEVSRAGDLLSTGDGLLYSAGVSVVVDGAAGQRNNFEYMIQRKAVGRI